MGLAGFYLIHDALEESLPLPKGKSDVALLLQDRLLILTAPWFIRSPMTPSAPVYSAIPPRERRHPALLPSRAAEDALSHSKRIECAHL
jgi:hypothetical protein